MTGDLEDPKDLPTVPVSRAILEVLAVLILTIVATLMGMYMGISSVRYGSPAHAWDLYKEAVSNDEILKGNIAGSNL